MFSTRPLVKVRLNGTRSFTGQIGFDYVVYHEIRYLETFRAHDRKIFRINDKYYHFINYTLQHSSVDVIELSPALSPIPIKIQELNYVDSFKSFTTSFPQNDYNSILTTVYNDRLITNQIGSFMAENQKNNIHVSPAAIKKKISKIISNSFLQILAEITDPALSTIITILLILSMFWGTILTYSYCKQTCSTIFNRVQPPLMPVMERAMNRINQILHRQPAPTPPPAANPNPELIPLEAVP